MSKVTLTIDGVRYVPDERQLDMLEMIRDEHFAEVDKINKENPPTGALDGPGTRLRRAALDRYRERVRSLLVDGIEPVPDKQTGLGAWAR